MAIDTNKIVSIEYEVTSDGKVVASFEIEGKEFKVHKATKHKCPRCWRFASHSKDEPCSRCQEVLA